jgi:hypothetical protein
LGITNGNTISRDGYQDGNGRNELGFYAWLLALFDLGAFFAVFIHAYAFPEKTNGLSVFGGLFSLSIYMDKGRKYNILLHFTGSSWVILPGRLLFYT